MYTQNFGMYIGLTHEWENKLKDYTIGYNSLCFDDNVVAKGLYEQL